MTAPAGTEVGLYVDLQASVAIGDIIETRSGRRYGVVSVRVQARGKNAGRQHLRAVVLEQGATFGYEGLAAPTVHRIRWYVRGKRGGGGIKGKNRR